MQDSTDATRMGMNRTGMQMSPHQSQEMLEGMAALDPISPDAESEELDGQALSVTRLEYIAAADPLGSVPPPATSRVRPRAARK